MRIALAPLLLALLLLSAASLCHASQTWTLPRQTAATRKQLRAVSVGQHVHVIDAAFARRHQDYFALMFASADELRSEIDWLRWSPDGRLIAAVCDSGRVLVVNGTTGGVVTNIAVSPEAVYAVDFSADSRMVFTGGEDALVRAFAFSPSSPSKLERPDGGLAKAMRGHQSRIRALAAHPTDPTLLATGANEPAHVFLWNLTQIAAAQRPEDAKPALRMEGHKKPLRWLEFLPGGEEIVSVGYSGEIWMHDAKTGAPTMKEPIKIHKGQPVVAVAVQRPPSVPVHGPPSSSSSVSQQQQQPAATTAFMPLVATGGYDGLVWIFQHAQKGRLSVVVPTIARSVLEEAAVSSLSFSMDGRVLAVATTALASKSKRSSVTFISMDTMKRIGEPWFPHGDAAGTVYAAFSPTRQTVIATASADGIVRLWDLTFGEVVESSPIVAGSDDDDDDELEVKKNSQKSSPFVSVKNGLETVKSLSFTESGDDVVLNVEGDRGTKHAVKVPKARSPLEGEKKKKKDKKSDL